MANYTQTPTRPALDRIMPRARQRSLFAALAATWLLSSLFPLTYALDVYVIPHSHTDPGWKDTVQQYSHRVSQILSHVVKNLCANSNRTFLWSEVSFLARWASGPGGVGLAGPACVSRFGAGLTEFDAFRKLVDAGQMEIVGGGWVQHDEAVTSLYGMVDQMRLGHSWLKRHVNSSYSLAQHVPARIGYHIDSFGHSSVTPLLFAQMGYTNTLINRIPFWQSKSLGLQRNKEMWWRGMFTHIVNGHYNTMHALDWEHYARALSAQNVEGVAKQVVEFVQTRKKHYSTDSNLLLLLWGDDFRFNSDANWANMEILMQHINAHSDRYGVRMRYCHLWEYFRDERALLGVDHSTTPQSSDVVSYHGDFFPYSDTWFMNVWSGFYSTRPVLKQRVRLAEHRLRSADVLLTQALVAFTFSMEGPPRSPSLLVQFLLQSKGGGSAPDWLDEMLELPKACQHAVTFSSWMAKEEASPMARRMARQRQPSLDRILRLQQLLGEAHDLVGILQHHDAITGTCTNHVYWSYLRDARCVELASLKIQAAASALLMPRSPTLESLSTLGMPAPLPTQEMESLDMNTEMFIDGGRTTFVPSPGYGAREGIDAGGKQLPRVIPLVVVNSLASQRTDAVEVRVDTPYVRVQTYRLTPHGGSGGLRSVVSQLLPPISGSGEHSGFRLVFRAHVPPLGFRVYFLTYYEPGPPTRSVDFYNAPKHPEDSTVISDCVRIGRKSSQRWWSSAFSSLVETPKLQTRDVRVEFDPSSFHISTISQLRQGRPNQRLTKPGRSSRDEWNLDLHQSFLRYESLKDSSFFSSGAYTFKLNLYFVFWKWLAIGYVAGAFVGVWVSLGMYGCPVGVYLALVTLCNKAGLPEHMARPLLLRLRRKRGEIDDKDHNEQHRPPVLNLSELGDIEAADASNSGKGIPLHPLRHSSSRHRLTFVNKDVTEGSGFSPFSSPRKRPGSKRLRSASGRLLQQWQRQEKHAMLGSFGGLLRMSWVQWVLAAVAAVCMAKLLHSLLLTDPSLKETSAGLQLGLLFGAMFAGVRRLWKLWLCCLVLTFPAFGAMYLYLPESVAQPLDPSSGVSDHLRTCDGPILAEADRQAAHGVSQRVRVYHTVPSEEDRELGIPLMEDLQDQLQEEGDVFRNTDREEGKERGQHLNTLYWRRGVVEVVDRVRAEPNQELVTRYTVQSSSLPAATSLLTDNGLHLVVRPSYRPLHLVPGNYYPMISQALLGHVHSPDHHDSTYQPLGRVEGAYSRHVSAAVAVAEPAFAVVTSQGLGVTKFFGNTLELMLHRRLTQDDEKGLAEDLDDRSTAEVPQWLLWGSCAAAGSCREHAAIAANNPFQVLVFPRAILTDAKEWDPVFLSSFSVGMPQRGGKRGFSPPIEEDIHLLALHVTDVQWRDHPRKGKGLRTQALELEILVQLRLKDNNHAMHTAGLFSPRQSSTDDRTDGDGGYDRAVNIVNLLGRGPYEVVKATRATLGGICTGEIVDPKRLVVTPLKVGSFLMKILVYV